MLKKATSESTHSQVLVIVMEEGIAHLVLVSKHTEKLKAKIEKSISKKKAFASNHAKQTDKFHNAIEVQLEAQFGEKEHGALLKSIQAVVIGSPGFYKNKLLEYLTEES